MDGPTIVAIETGVEVRVGYTVEDIVRTQLTPDIGTARALAASWRQALIEKGFTERPTTDAPPRPL